MLLSEKHIRSGAMHSFREARQQKEQGEEFKILKRVGLANMEGMFILLGGSRNPLPTMIWPVFVVLVTITFENVQQNWHPFPANVDILDILTIYNIFLSPYLGVLRKYFCVQ